MTRILILGASGFIGGAIYKELCNYFDTFGTYHTGRIFSENKHFFHYDMESEDLFNILLELRPTLIISALRGPFEAQVIAHGQIAAYSQNTGAKVIFLSSANVFDAFSNYPSYEYDKTLSESPYGKLKIRLENMFMKLPERQYIIARLPMVFGRQSPRIRELRYHLTHKVPFEVFPNLVMNVTSDDILTRQIHYMINRKRRGIFHLGSTDLIHHNEFIEECCSKLGFENPYFKNVYTSNFDRFLAVLPRFKKLPKHLMFSHLDVVEELRQL